jgi:acetyltransferase-like isoleucine patch superfamily enzyme
MRLLHSDGRVPSEDPLLWVPRFLTKANSIWMKLTYPFASFGRGISVHYTCEIHRFYAHRLHIGDSVIMDPDVWLNIPVDACDPQASMVIGKGCKIGRRSVISAKNRIVLEDDVLFAPGVFITDHNHDYVDIETAIWKQGTTPGGTILIERNCWLGYGSMVLATKGDVVVGRNSVVGAYSVVTESCPPYSVLVGNPARIVKQFDPNSKMWLKYGESDRYKGVESATLR